MQVAAFFCRTSPFDVSIRLDSASEIARFNCFVHPLIGLPPVYAAGLAAMQGIPVDNLVY